MFSHPETSASKHKKPLTELWQLSTRFPSLSSGWNTSAEDNAAYESSSLFLPDTLKSFLQKKRFKKKTLWFMIINSNGKKVSCHILSSISAICALSGCRWLSLRPTTWDLRAFGNLRSLTLSRQVFLIWTARFSHNLLNVELKRRVPYLGRQPW